MLEMLIILALYKKFGPCCAAWGWSAVRLLCFILLPVVAAIVLLVAYWHWE
jgi:hypothetical protein